MGYHHDYSSRIIACECSLRTFRNHTFIISALMEFPNYVQLDSIRPTQTTKEGPKEVKPLCLFRNLFACVI